ncbi:growth/differentiation factor 8-like [Diadema setosum]|uniref:growth/differentiation factor 8-like n=1 Tax=Diadema setosum TaxID=31175 RepID=UPI003B3B1930
MSSSSSHPLQACIVCLVLLCNCIHLWATPTRIAEWPKLQLFGENARVTLSREIRRSTMSMAASNHPEVAPGLSSSPSSTKSSSKSKMASSSTSSSMSTPPSSTMTFGCASCKLRGLDGSYPGEQGSRPSTMTATEKQLRIQALKRQILDALNLSEPPKLKANPPTISQDVMEKVFGESENANNKADDREDDDVDNMDSDFKEKDKQFILGVAGPANGIGNDLAVKMRFFLSESVQVAEVVDGKLWIHVLNSTSAIRRSVVVTQRLAQTNIVASQRVNDTGGWIGIDLSPSWSSSEPSVVFEVTADPAHEATINMTARPILEVRVLTRVRRDEVRRRARRGATCKSNNPSTCCLQAFTVTKTELGWDWLIHPTEMVVNYCRGSCDSGIYHMYNHSDIMYTRGMLETDPSLRALLMPCCTSKRLASVQLIYYQDGSAMTTKNIPNLKVLECGCA